MRHELEWAWFNSFTGTWIVYDEKRKAPISLSRRAIELMAEIQSKEPTMDGIVINDTDENPIVGKDCTK